ncbi:MAG: class I SAM-dependent methyltransferase [Flavobacteriales bacterium]|nr:class I SAM-dependent methyltransferase [Flavobacteriales bacterium]
MNRVLNKLRSPVVLHSRFDHREDMVSMEQISNLELLFTDVVDRKVPGAVVELGCYMGSTAAVFASLLQAHDAKRPFHVYDRFDIELGTSHGVWQAFARRMLDAKVPMPTIHPGDILDTVPRDLPQAIAFAHVDLGTGSEIFGHVSLMAHGLSHIYARMSRGGVIVFMDYHVPGRTVQGNDSNPGVRLTVDTFFENKPEKPRILYGGPCSHAYIRKQ